MRRTFPRASPHPFSVALPCPYGRDDDSADQSCRHGSVTFLCYNGGRDGRTRRGRRWTSRANGPGTRGPQADRLQGRAWIALAARQRHPTCRRARPRPATVTTYPATAAVQECHPARLFRRREHGGQTRPSTRTRSPRDPPTRRSGRVQPRQATETPRFQERLSDLTRGIQEPPPTQDGRRAASGEGRLFAMAFKVYSTVSGRRFTGAYRTRARRAT